MWRKLYLGYFLDARQYITQYRSIFNKIFDSLKKWLSWLILCPLHMCKPLKVIVHNVCILSVLLENLWITDTSLGTLEKFHCSSDLPNIKYNCAVLLIVLVTIIFIVMVTTIVKPSENILISSKKIEFTELTARVLRVIWKVKAIFTTDYYEVLFGSFLPFIFFVQFKINELSKTR